MYLIYGNMCDDIDTISLKFCDKIQSVIGVRIFRLVCKSTSSVLNKELLRE